MSLTLRHLCLLLTILIGCQPMAADKTLRGKLRPDKSALTKKSANNEPAVCPPDTIAFPPADDVKLAGYDKPLTSRTESLFVSNNTDRDITEIAILLTYTDMQGRTLHERTQSVRTFIPRSSTRRIAFSSWDSQNSFFYHKGKKPRTNNVTPFDVKCKVTRYVTPANK